MAAKGKLVLPRVAQIALIVKNMEKTASYLSSSLGIGPFQFSERVGPATVDGKPTQARRKLGIIELKDIQLELIEGPDKGTPYYDFIYARGEGWQHIRFETFESADDLDRWIDHLKGHGWKVKYAGEYGGGRFAYLESDQAKGCILEFSAVVKK
ncbi:MAG: VOC family protein [Dehalococcoidales bacterium]|nr:VOC family protein [Dehalococcoidales bacterium]